MRFLLLICAFIMIASAAPEGSCAEEIMFETEDSVTIAGSFFPPPESPAPAVVLIHMLRKDRQSWTDFAQEIQKAGFAVLTFDLRGHGQSLQSHRGPISEGAFSEKNFADMRYDVTAAIQWLRKRPDVLPSKIALVGASIGANVAVNYAAEDKNICTVVLLSPGMVYRGIWAEPALKAYLPRPVFIAAAEDDNYSAVTANTFASLVKAPNVVKIFENGGHGNYLLRSRPELVSMILDFLRTNLR